MIVGYILVAIAINIKGDVVGKVLNYYMTKQNCHTAKIKQEKLSEPEKRMFVHRITKQI